MIRDVKSSLTAIVVASRRAIDSYRVMRCNTCYGSSHETCNETNVRYARIHVRDARETGER